MKDGYEKVTAVHSNALTGLFFPPTRYDYKKISVRMALDAIKQFRTTGRVDWRDVPGIAKCEHEND